MQQLDNGDEAGAEEEERDDQQDPSHRLVRQRAAVRHVGAPEHELAWKHRKQHDLRARPCT